VAGRAPPSWIGISAALFTAIHTITASYDECYPCALREAAAPAEKLLTTSFERSPGVRANDGVVPLRSQIWGDLVWTGHGDHLDVLGHYRDTEGSDHHDWLSSGSQFDAAQFDGLVDAIARRMVTVTA
jgi:triacylglycerol lipase